MQEKTENQVHNIDQYNRDKTDGEDLLQRMVLNEQQVANVLNVSRSTVADLRQKGKLTYVLISSKNRVYLVKDVEKFLQENRCRAGAVIKQME